MDVEVVADYACECGEGPLWHPDERRLYWTDIPTRRLFRYDPATGEHETCLAGHQVGGFTIQADGGLLLFMDRGAVAKWHGDGLDYVVREIPEERATRFNDVIADPAGRVFCGTMPASDRLGRLYRLDTDGTITRLLDGCGCANGMGFTADRRRMYFTDSTPRAIYAFDYDEATGALANRSVFVDSSDCEGVPDGMTVDAEGCVWSARWGGGCIYRYSTKGEQIGRFEIPAPKVTCLTFAADDRTDIYITTAGGDSKDTDGSAAGALLRARTGVGGVPEFRSRVCI